jgi:hypothetical protein
MPKFERLSKEKAKQIRTYIASKTKYAPKWRDLRSAGYEIISTWIDEAGLGESSDLQDLAIRCIDEASFADRLILYVQPDETLKGALIEVGAALANQVPVFVVGVNEQLISALNNHPYWFECISLEEALEAISHG